MKKILFKTVLCVVISIFMGMSFLFAQKINNIPTDVDIYANKLATSLSKEDPGNFGTTTMRSVLYNYCRSVLNTSIEGLNITGDNYYYSAKNSVFLYIICHNISSDFDGVFGPKFSSKEDGYFTRSSFTGLGIVDYSQDPNIDYCNSTGTLQYCDLTYHIPRIFNMIINDIFSIQQSRIYGLTTPDFDKKKIEDQIDDYAKDKFNIKFCDSTDGKYPKLCKTMKNYTKASARLLKDLDILNYDNLYKDFGGDLSSYSLICEKMYGTYEFDSLSCGLFGYGFGIHNMYTNLVYNEFLYYSLFVKYYNNVILNNPNLAPSKQRDNYSLAVDYLKNNAYEFNREVNASQRGISVAMKMLREIDMSFPLHVGLMMYQEDLLNLRDKSLYKIVTPFYTLYGKLRNVQTKDK